MENSKEPLDEVGHGDGNNEASLAGAEADNDFGEVGTCPSCLILPLKVGDSFVAEVNDFAQALLYATDAGASVAEEALATLNNSALGQAAVNYATDRGVVVVAGAANEEAGHHNYPSNYARTLVVNSVRNNESPAQQPRSYLYLNGCTNYGAKVVLSVPSVQCSAEATGRAPGMAGLVHTAGRNAGAQGRRAPYPGLPGLSADEVKQVMAMTADDIDFEDP